MEVLIHDDRVGPAIVVDGLESIDLPPHAAPFCRSPLLAIRQAPRGEQPPSTDRETSGDPRDVEHRGGVLFPDIDAPAVNLHDLAPNLTIPSLFGIAYV